MNNCTREWSGFHGPMVYSPQINNGVVMTNSNLKLGLPPGEWGKLKVWPGSDVEHPKTFSEHDIVEVFLRDGKRILTYASRLRWDVSIDDDSWWQDVFLYRRFIRSTAS